ncbi:hypothetical protein QC823_13380 [Halomonas vilamensis]|uniref:Uncharacterized protein n=1 Tax=Vreelandella vilamensis TaxID=531309 RepID=A0ABU1H6P7_9GAMM|nr:hypothetical protein [Halomonas vilamensis]MDR5899978.1 hypothetical protein [Halomonas vilamensis]
MAAIDYLKQHELEAELREENRLRVWPKENITPAVRDWIKQHKAELLTELSAANHHHFTFDERRRAWTVRIGDKRMTVVSPMARTKAETAASVSARWPRYQDVEVIA